MLRKAQMEIRTPESDMLRTVVTMLSVTVSSILAKDQIIFILGSSWQCADCSWNSLINCCMKPRRSLISPHRSVFFGSNPENYRYNSEHRKRKYREAQPHSCWLPVASLCKDSPTWCPKYGELPGWVHDLAHWPPTTAILKYQWR